MNGPSELEKKRLQELALRAHYSGSPAFTRFLEPALERAARFAAAQAEVQITFWGGYENAERCIAAFHSGEAPEEWEYPLSCLELKWNSKYACPGHRDLLGAVMGLGLERSATGDIVPSETEGIAYLFAHNDVESYICANLESAGRASLKVQPLSGEMKIKAPEGEDIRATVSSERLDAVLAAGLKLSRNDAQKLIASGHVKRNHIEELRGDIHLLEGDLLSVRGFGRMKVVLFDGITRKGRLFVRLFRYKG